MLTTETITFGKYKGSTLGHVLKDRNYCKWLIDQDWFKKDNEYLFNRITQYNPKAYFMYIPTLPSAEPMVAEPIDFMDKYQYFNLYPLDRIDLPLTASDKLCYTYYLKMIDSIKDKIYQRLENEEENPYDIKAPVKWLQVFEKEMGIPRTDLKEFLDAYDLPNIPYIIEDIKAEGGIEYKGAKSFIIAKTNSLEQEAYWETILKDRYGENVAIQYLYEKCIFDFINIKTNTIFECKLGLKDFCEEQHTKYKIVLTKFRIIYLISKDCVIDIEKKKLYTTNVDYYQVYKIRIPTMKTSSYLDNLLLDCEVVHVEDLAMLFN